MKPQINIDTDGDGRPDVNLDFDGDGVPDINIDTDGDNIPDLNIDSTGDGKPDINVDTDDDGKPDENIVKITEWKPGHNADEPFPYDTMTFDDSEPEEPNTPTEPSDQEPTNVNGAYYPGDNMGGALTGDSSNAFMFIGMMFGSLGFIFFILYKSKEDKC